MSTHKQDAQNDTTASPIPEDIGKWEKSAKKKLEDIANGDEWDKSIKEKLKEYIHGDSEELANLLRDLVKYKCTESKSGQNFYIGEFGYSKGKGDPPRPFIEIRKICKCAVHDNCGRIASTTTRTLASFAESIRKDWDKNQAKYKCREGLYMTK